MTNLIKGPSIVPRVVPTKNCYSDYDSIDVNSGHRMFTRLATGLVSSDRKRLLNTGNRKVQKNPRNQRTSGRK